jgi:methyl-accepting chemotaxis protein
MSDSKTAKLADGIDFRAALLALSASVEMACAGEGRTEFVLVASKIRDLARRGALVAKPPGPMNRNEFLE